MAVNNKTAKVNLDTMLSIFTVPEAPHSKLSKIEQELSQNLNLFLKEHIAAEEKPLTEIEKDFTQSLVPEKPMYVSEHTEHLLNKLVPHSVHTSSPSFIGHMTSALPYFLMPLSKVMIALNQNLVKIETSKAFTPMERQVLGMLHRLIYTQDSPFYEKWMHSADHSLGTFCSGGTIANITALWVARNRLLKPQGDFEGVAKQGLFSALMHYRYNGLAIFVSERGHYSLKKAADVLGIGQDGVIAIKTDHNNRICITDLKAKIEQSKANNIKPLAIIGVAGTTETGSIDPLLELAEIAQQEQCHFHVDAAWGGATLMSEQYRHLLNGIQLADSVTIDAHKQLYVPMGSGMVIFKDPELMSSIQHHADYILRKGSKDLGRHTLEGSRNGIAMLLYSCFHIISRSGYELLINQSIEKAHYFSELIKQQDDFELITEPELCLLTYRYIPKEIKHALKFANLKQKDEIYLHLNNLTKYIQKIQREKGKSFVSRTTLTPEKYQNQLTIVLRVVLANPLTTQEILQSILNEQRNIVKNSRISLPLLQHLAKQIMATKPEDIPEITY